VATKTDQTYAKLHAVGAVEGWANSAGAPYVDEQTDATAGNHAHRAHAIAGRLYPDAT
jgi:hypothetical protein